MKNFFLLSLLLFSLPAICQTDTSKIEFVAYWSKGDIYNFKITKIKEKWKAGVLEESDSSQYTVKFEVIDSSQSSYTIKWNYQNFLYNDLKLSEDLTEKLSQYKFTNLIYKTSELGIFLGIENYEEISKMTKEIFASVLNEYNDNEIREKLKKKMEPVLAAYSTRQGLEQHIFKELNHFHFPFGVAYNLTDTLIYEEELTTVFGDQKIKGKSKVFMESLNMEESQCVIIHQMKLDQEDTRKVVLKLLQKMGMKDREMKNAIKTAIFDINDNNRFEFYYYPGVPIRIEVVRETLLDIEQEKARRIDKVLIELID